MMGNFRSRRKLNCFSSAPVKRRSDLLFTGALEKQFSFRRLRKLPIMDEGALEKQFRFRRLRKLPIMNFYDKNFPHKPTLNLYSNFLLHFCTAVEYSDTWPERLEWIWPDVSLCFVFLFFCFLFFVFVFVFFFFPCYTSLTKCSMVKIRGLLYSRSLPVFNFSWSGKMFINFIFIFTCK